MRLMGICDGNSGLSAVSIPCGLAESIFLTELKCVCVGWVGGSQVDR